MNRNSSMRLQAAFLMLLSGLLLGGWAPAWAGDAAKARLKVEEAADVLSDIMESPDKGIPKDLLRNAAGVAIFPGVIKGGFVVGAEYGRGVILHHDKQRNRWSPPAFYSIAAGSFGWQIGAQSTDLILVFRSERGFKAMLGNEFKLGADASVAAGPVGRKMQAGTDLSLKAEIFSYSRSRGLFAGLALEGAKINELPKYNRAFYGRKVSAEDILLGGRVRAPKAAKKLIAALARASR